MGDLKKISKNFLHKDLHNRIRKVKDKKERDELHRFSIMSNLKLRYSGLEEKIMKKSGKENSIAKLKLSILKPKIGVFEITRKMKDFNKVVKLIEEIEKEVESV